VTQALDQVRGDEPLPEGEPLPESEFLPEGDPLPESEPLPVGEEVEVEPQDDGELEAEAELDPEVIARRDAALAHVRKFGDPVLKTRARPVEHFDDALRDEVRQMGLLMDDALGIGLAATQVGVVHRLLVYRVQSHAPLAALANPVIEWSSKDEEIAEEGCLSLPLVHVDVERPVHVRVRAQDEYGELITIEASGLEARVIQHEMDHLDGVLIVDRTPRDQRKEAMRILREWQEQQRSE
jgi:peptide deformylase